MKEIKRYSGFETRAEADNKKDFVLNNGDFKLIGYGWSRELKHYFEVEK